MASLAQHPWSVEYCLLWLATWLIRLPALTAVWLGGKKKVLQTLGSDVSYARIYVPSRDKGRTITVDVYERVDQQKNAKRYAHINWHGSGFIIPSLTSDADFCAALARAGTTVFDADYRKAPEHPFPAAVHDAEDVLSYVRAQSSDFDTRHLTIGGFSAGANIAMSVAVNSPPGSVAGLVSVYGNTDMTRAYPTPETEYDGGMVLPGWLRWFFYKCLILPGQDKADRRLSPAYAPIERWPKHVYFACGAADSLHGAGKAMAEKLNAEGHMDVDFFSVGHAAHAFDKRVKEGSRSEKGRDETYQQAIEMIERAHTDG